MRCELHPRESVAICETCACYEESLNASGPPALVCLSLRADHATLHLRLRDNDSLEFFSNLYRVQGDAYPLRTHAVTPTSP